METLAVWGSRSWETMWWPRKPQPPITRTEVETLCAFGVDILRLGKDCV